MADIDSLIAVKTQGDAQDLVQVKLTDASGVEQAAIADGKLNVKAFGSDGTNRVLLTDANGVLQVNIATAAGTPIHIYDTATPAGGATRVKSYTTTAAFVLKRVFASGSGPIKCEVATGASGSETVKAVGFSLAGGNVVLEFENTPVVSGDVVKVTVTNRDSKTADVHLTIMGTNV